MTWSYDPGLLTTDRVTQVRFLIGDTNPREELVQDEEILFALTERRVYGAAALCLRNIANRLSREADSVQQELRTLYSSRARAFAARAAEMEVKAVTRGGALPFAGGLSVAE
jgi:hypothetical protein